MTGKPQPSTMVPQSPSPEEGASAHALGSRALGRREPPAQIEVEGMSYQLVEVLSHDAWMARAIYEGPTRRIVCKFNRQQPVWRVPMSWLGRLLAEREKRVLKKVTDISNVPRWSGEVLYRGKRLLHAVAHDVVAAHPLSEQERVADGYFPTLRQVVQEMHRRGIAHAGLDSPGHVLVGNDGQPYLVSHQLSFILPRWWPGCFLPMRLILWLLQRRDEKQLQTLYARHRPDLCGMTSRSPRGSWWPWLQRLAAAPWRSLGRLLPSWVSARGGERAAAG